MTFDAIAPDAADLDLAEVREVGALVILAARQAPERHRCAAYIRAEYGHREVARGLARERARMGLDPEPPGVA